MLSEQDLDGVQQQLQDFERRDQGHHDALTSVLQKYKSLLEDYRSLKSDYEEEKECREKYKRLARGVDRGSPIPTNASRPFVVVLIDGDNYIFSDRLLQLDEEGGARAAQELHNAIEKSLMSHGLADCDVLIRIYADFMSLSKRLTQEKLIKSHKRSIATFAAAMTQYRPLLDFIDCGEASGSSVTKISEMFRFYAETMKSTSSPCKHIFLGVSHDMRFLPVLRPMQGEQRRFTLINTGVSRREFDQLGLGHVDFTGIFRDNTLGSVHAQTSFRPPIPTAHSTQERSQQFSPPFRSVSGSPQDMSTVPSTHHPSPISTRQFTRSTQISVTPFCLPKASKEHEGLIPINAAGHRIDTQILQPSEATQRSYEVLSPRPCNNHHLEGICSKIGCTYGHEPIDPQIANIMRLKLRNVACQRRGRCRRKNCILGHVCVKPGCNSGRKKLTCRLFQNMHDIDTTVLEWVTPENDQQNSQGDNPEEDLIMMETGRDRSSSRNNHGYDSGASLCKSSTWQNASEEQQTESDWQDQSILSGDPIGSQSSPFSGVDDDESVD